MKSAKMDPSGLSSFMQKLKAEIYMPTSQQSEYIQTHPLVDNRIEALQHGIAESSFKGKGFPAEWNEEHKRMKAKLLGFINPNQVPWVYDDRDQSVAASYARAIAAYRGNKVQDALKRMDALLQKEPQNPYFQELKGQMLVDFGRGEEALPYYRKAITLKPNAALLRIAMGHALIESADKGDAQARLREAIDELEVSLDREPRYSRTHRLLATAYGKLGDENMAKVHLAEEAMQQSRYDYAKSQAEEVVHNAKEGSKAWLKAKDVLSFVEVAEKR
jgi:predicted Zn-dependent protease